MIRSMPSFPNEATVTDQRYDEIDGLTELITLEMEIITLALREEVSIQFILRGQNKVNISYTDSGGWDCHKCHFSR